MAANKSMTNAKRQLPSALLVSGRIFIMGGAGLLILVGLMLQLGAFGYGHLQPGNFWIASTIMEHVWSMLIALLDSPGVQELATFWPLLLISMGLALLLVTKGEESQRALSSFRGGQNHGH